MKKIVFVYVGLIVAVILLALLQRGSFNLFGGGNQTVTSAKKPTASINGKTFNLLLADDEKERRIGLSDTKKLDQNSGMLFVFDKKGKYPFWMKEMEFPIDIIYINDNKVVEVFPDAKPPVNPEDTTKVQIFTPKSDANYVLEINSGLAKKHNIKIGNTISLKDLK